MAYKLGKFEEAIREYEAAYKALPEPAFLFNLAQSHRRQYKLDQDPKHLQTAINLYRTYLKEVPAAQNKDAVRNLIGEVQKLLDSVEERNRLSREPGVLVLSAADEQSHGAAVQIDDKPAGVLPTSQTLKPGIHFVKVTRVGFASWTSSVTVSPGSRVELPVLMRPVAAGGGGPTPRPIYKRWWFWTVIGAVVAAGATTGIYFAARPAAPPSMPQLDLR